MDTCFSAKIMDSVIEWGIEQDNMITMYHNQLKKLYFRTCLFQIDVLKEDCDDSRHYWIDEKQKYIGRGDDQEDIDDAEEHIEYNQFKPSTVKSKQQYYESFVGGYDYYYRP